ncbi:sulfotransferase family 2 domain-containing protein [Alteromonas halophila]|uniref:Sulfotransferase domain-containing protein n=1 Tax=Alteromonas halophila TaxID=516698 RepID=A0A918MY60_9ALTE|nr:sulfotransferase family 2 domain-containing protein [Alteromonas halophila]GGW86985.1 hypothetical protein GCM10007391_20980 [Alteromonas halophila]
MLITKKFVLLNYPKTGSTFAREAIQKLYSEKYRENPVVSKILRKLKVREPAIQELMLPNIKVKGVSRPRDQHGCYCQIPSRYKNREVVTVVRNPFTRFLSAYKYGWWKKYPPVSQLLLDKHFPHFPDLSFDEYVDLTELGVEHGRLGRPPGNLGSQTVQFIQMFFNNPESTLEKVDDKYLENQQYLKDVPAITFLRQETLNEDLAEFLIQKGFSADDVNFILNMKKINTTNSEKVAGAVWTPKTLSYVKHKEKAMFDIFREKGINYDSPL